MDFNQLFSLTKLLIEHPYIVYLLILIIFVFISFIIWKWSIYIFFKDRIWRLLIGKQYANFSVPNLCEFHNNNIEIAHFNVLYGVSANTIEQILKYQTWLYKNGVTFIQISKIKPYFNIENLSLKKIKKKLVIKLSILWLVLCIMMFLCLNFTLTSSALVKLKNDESLLWLSNNSAKSAKFLLPPSIVNPRWTLNISMCKSNEFDITKWSNLAQMSEESAKIICQLFSDEKSHQEVSKIVKEQRITYGLLSLILLFINYYVIRDIRKIKLVFKLRVQISKRRRAKK